MSPWAARLLPTASFKKWISDREILKPISNLQLSLTKGSLTILSCWIEKQRSRQASVLRMLSGGYQVHEMLVLRYQPQSGQEYLLDVKLSQQVTVEVRLQTGC